jgi:integrase
MWLARAEISAGYVFRKVDRGGNVIHDVPLGDDGWCKVIKKRALQAGLDPALFSGHSMRAGFLTSAAESGADVLKMSEVSRHKSLHVLRRYVRRSNLFKAHAGAGFLGGFVAELVPPHGWRLSISYGPDFLHRPQ